MLHRRRGDAPAAAAALLRTHAALAQPHRRSGRGDAAAQRAAALAPSPTLQRIAAVRAVSSLAKDLLALELTHLALRELPEEVAELKLPKP